MKTKLYKYGTLKYKAYYKTAGKGFEVGFLYGNKPLFVGNFVKKEEATTWFEMMTHEIERFSNKYWHNVKTFSSTVFFHKFATNNLYKHYYDYLDKCFGKHTKNYHREFSRDVKSYERMKRHWAKKENTAYTRRAS
jgi:hypothetical protein